MNLSSLHLVCGGRSHLDAKALDRTLKIQLHCRVKARGYQFSARKIGVSCNYIEENQNQNGRLEAGDDEYSCV